MRKTGPTLLRNTITRLWHYNVYLQKPYDSGYIFIVLFKTLYLLEIFLNIYKKSRLQSQNRKIKHINYGRTKLYNMETGAYKFINFRIRFSNGIMNFFCNFRGKYETFPDIQNLLNYKRMHFYYNKKFTRFTYIENPQTYIYLTKNALNFFQNKKQNKFLFKIQNLTKLIPLLKRNKIHNFIFSKSVINTREKIISKLKYNWIWLKHQIISPLKKHLKKMRTIPFYTRVHTKQLLKKNNKNHSKKKINKIFNYNTNEKTPLHVSIYYTNNFKKKKYNTFKYLKKKKNITKFFRKLYYKKKTNFFYTKQLKSLTIITQFWYAQIFNRLLEYKFSNFITKTTQIQNTMNFFLQQEFSIPRATKTLFIYKQNMWRTTYYLKRAKFYKEFVNLLPTIQTFHAVDLLAKQIAIELTRTKKHWKVVKGTETLISRAYVQMRNDAIKGSAGLSGLCITISGCFGRASRARTVILKFGILTKASFFETDVTQSLAAAKATRGSFSVTVTASS